jgi:hypothetical protein
MLKGFIDFLTEAVAAKAKTARKTAKPRKPRKPSKAPVLPKSDVETFKAKFDRLMSGTGSRTPWNLTGHVGKDFDPTGEIERMKTVVFGKRTGNSELGWYLADGGLVTVTATANATHSMVQDNPWDYGIPDEITDKLEYFNIIAWLRIEHHEGGRGVIAVSFMGGEDKSVIRSLRRKYPKYVIHDGHGNEFMESYIHEEAEPLAKYPKGKDSTMTEHGNKDFEWGGWRKPYDYLLAENTTQISQKIARVVNELADDLHGGAGYEWSELPRMTSYSGRGMMGKYCLGVSVSRYAQTQLLNAFKKNGIPAPSQDQLGMGAIYYWQNIPYDPMIHKNIVKSPYEDDED